MKTLEKIIESILRNYKRKFKIPIHRNELLALIKLEYPYKLSDRALRKTVENMVKEGGYPIGTSEEGYFWIENNEDLEKAIRPLEKKALSILERKKKLVENWQKNYQMEFKL